MRIRRLVVWIMALSLALGILAWHYAAGESRATAARRAAVSVVIDPGHGGEDRGAAGDLTGAQEDTLNLAVSLLLRDVLAERGYRVTMTRDSDKIDISDVPGIGFKKRDMQRRRRIINDTDADIVISIHMNRYPSPQPQGSQVFHAPGSGAGAQLAACIQARLHAVDGSDGRRKAAEGDFFILRASDAVSVLVECGFLSHPEEELRLTDPSYQRELAGAIADGLDDYAALCLRERRGEEP